MSLSAAIFATCVALCLAVANKKVLDGKGRLKIWAMFQYKGHLSRYRISIIMIRRPCGNCFTGKTGYLYEGKPQGRLNITMSSYHRNFHYRDKMVSRPSYLDNGVVYIWKDRIYIETWTWMRSARQLFGMKENMMTSWMETFSALLAIFAGNSPVTGEFPSQRPVTQSFDVFFRLRLNKRLRKQSWGRWFERPSRSLWRHCNGVALQND